MSRRITALDEEFDQLFARFRYAAFRLETLQRYDVPYEVEQVRRFLAGEDPLEDSDNPAKNHWLGMLRESRDAGKRVQRVHVIEEPLSDYIRFELAWPYQETVSAGEDVRLIPVRRGQWPSDLPRHDYWLFDSRELVVMQYNTAGTFLAADFVDDPAEIVKHNYWRDAALYGAVPYSEYVEARGEEASAAVAFPRSRSLR